MKNKKIIAREFLFLLGSIIISTVLFVIWQWEKSELFKATKNVVNEIELCNRENDYISILFKSISDIDNSFISKYSLDVFSEKLQNIDYATKLYKWICDVDQTFSNDVSLEKFISKVKYEDKRNSNFMRHNQLRNTLDSYEKKIFNLSMDNFWYLVLILFSITFGLRYLFYATKWSIKTIKSKD